MVGRIRVLGIMPVYCGSTRILRGWQYSQYHGAQSSEYAPVLAESKAWVLLELWTRSINEILRAIRYSQHKARKYV